MSRISALPSAVLAFAAAILCLAAFPRQALAYDYWDGGWQQVACRGAQCTVDTVNPAVGGGDGSSGAWVMIADTTGPQRYVQIGWTEDNAYTGESPRYFWEYSNDDLHWHLTYGSRSPATGSDVFKITDDSTSYYLSIAGSLKLTLAKSTLTWSSPNFVEMSGETYYQTDQCPGTTADPCSFVSATYKGSSGTWYQSSMSPLIDLPTMKNSLVTGARTWNIWDSRY